MKLFTRKKKSAATSKKSPEKPQKTLTKLLTAEGWKRKLKKEREKLQKN